MRRLFWKEEENFNNTFSRAAPSPQSLCGIALSLSAHQWHGWKRHTVHHKHTQTTHYIEHTPHTHRHTHACHPQATLLTTHTHTQTHTHTNTHIHSHINYVYMTLWNTHRQRPPQAHEGLGNNITTENVASQTDVQCMQQNKMRIPDWSRIKHTQFQSQIPLLPLYQLPRTSVGITVREHSHLSDWKDQWVIITQSIATSGRRGRLAFRWRKSLDTNELQFTPKASPGIASPLIGGLPQKCSLTCESDTQWVILLPLHFFCVTI